ncbi:MAG TPA: DUF4013 domain-containing protein [Aggregatilineales bacterium]|nr:DUF4013 domain-containing protein [Aggregatilineales bacterium]
MQFIKALTYAFKEHGWPYKLALAVAAAAIPFAGYFIIKGWEYEISVRVRHDSAEKLPGWRDVLAKLGRGVLLRVTGILYNLPALIMLVVSLWAWIMVFVLFFRLEERSLAILGDMLQQGVGLRLGLLVLTALVALASNTLYWSGYLRYIETNRYLDFFDVVTNAKLSFANIWDDMAMAIFMFVLGLVVSGLGTLLTMGLTLTGFGAALAPIVVPALTLSFLSLVNGHLFGQLATRTLGPSAAVSLDRQGSRAR